MSADGPFALVAHTARAASAPGAFLAALVLAACALATAAPAVAASWATAALRDGVMVRALPSGREITMSWLGGPAGPARQQYVQGPVAAEDSWEILADDLGAVHDSMGPDLRTVTTPAGVLAISGRGLVGPSAANPGVQASQLALVAGPSLADAAQLIAGAWPGDVGTDGVVPVALTASVAEAASWPVGEARTVTFADGVSLEVELAGTVEMARADEALWGHTSGLLEPSYLPAGQGRVLDAQAIVSTGAWIAVDPVATPARTTAWFAVDGDALEAGRADEVARQARAFVGGEPKPLGTYSGAVTPTTQLAMVLDEFAGRQEVLTRLHVAALAGPVAAGLAALVLGTLLVGRRLDGATRLLAARGASRPQVAALRAGAVSAWIAPASLAGAGLGVAAGGPAWIGVLVAAGLTAACAGVAAVPPVGRRLAGSARAVAVTVVATVSAAAVLAVLRADGDDPLLVLAAPALALAAGLVAQRTLLGTLHGLARLGRARRGLTGSLGPVCATSGGPGGGAAILALVLGVALAVFSGALLTTLRAGVGDMVRQELGADVRVEPQTGFGPEAVAALAGTPGVRTAVPVAAVRGTVARVGASTETLTVVVVDTALLAGVQTGSSAADDWPDLPAGDDGGAVPVIASPWFVATLGDDDASIRGHALAPVAARTDTIPLVSGTHWVIVDAARADELLGSVLRADLVLVTLTEDAEPDAIAATLRDVADSAPTVVVAEDVVAARLAGPDVAGLLTTVVVAASASAVLGALALAMSVALGATQRRRLTGLLGAFGLRRSESRALAIWDSAPVAVAGVAAGTLAGIGLAWFVVPATDLAAFTGGRGGAVISPGLTALLVAVVALAAGVVVALAAAAVRHAEPSRALREMAGG